MDKTPAAYELEIAPDGERCWLVDWQTLGRGSGATDLAYLVGTSIADPFERADITSNTYWDWMIDRAYLTYAAQFIVREFLATFAEFPPRMKAASFSIDQVLAKMEQSMNAD